MIRWLIFCFGGILILTTAFLTNYRATHPADSIAIVVLEENYTESATKLVRIDMKHNQTTLFAMPFYGEQEIQHYEWSPDGKWLLVLLRDMNRSSELHIVSHNGLIKRQLYQSDFIFDYPRWSVDSQTIALAEHVDSTARDRVVIKQLDLMGQVISVILVEAEPRLRWDFAWRDDNTLWLSYSPTRPTGYFINVQTGHVTVNTDVNYPYLYNAVSPDGKWFLEVRAKGLELKDWYEPSHVQWTIPNETLPLTDALQAGWSADSQWVALLGYEVPAQQTSTSYYGLADIYIVNANGTEIIQLTNDERSKSLVMAEARNNIYAPFSPHNHWLVYLDDTPYPPIINAVRTDGSGEEITNWYSDSQTYITSAKWSPAIDAPIQVTELILGGIFLIPISLALTVWQIRRHI